MGEQSKSLNPLKIWAIVPVKPFSRAKSRLATVLTPDQRETLAQHMLRQCLHLLVGMHAFAEVLVVSRDSKALKIAHDFHAHTIQETGTPELNSALLRASQVANSRGAQGVFVMPADLPLVTVDDIDQILYLGRYNFSVVIMPNQAQDGTNGLLVAPPGLIPFTFGIGSFGRHKQLAEAAGATVHIYESPRMALDIDLPTDLEQYKDLFTTREIEPLAEWAKKSSIS